MLGAVLKEIIYNFQWIDLLDISVAFIIIYQLLALIKGTRALQVLTGLFLVGLLYILSITLGLVTVNEILSRFFNYIFIIVIIVFQDDVRKMLAKMGKTSFFRLKTDNKAEEEMIEQIIKASVSLSRKRTGALIVIERDMGLNDSIEVGTRLDSQVNSDLIVSIFSPDSPIHDGALLIKDSKIVAAGCFLPLTRKTNVDKALGTRHRAALGLTEVTDAIVVTVSEELREISIAKDGELMRQLDSPSLRKNLRDILGIKGASINEN